LKRNGRAGQYRNDQPDFEGAVLAVLSGLPPGAVVSYGEVAAEAGFPGAARAVGNLLRTTTADVPWWRVVPATGRLVAGNAREQAHLLRNEGVKVRVGRVSRP
jgi:methylated-DNA-protein-cysteine methyltransferase-like protein